MKKKENEIIMTELQKAMKVLRRHLKKDSDYFRSWKANIAVSMQDEGYRQKSRDSFKTRHSISNKAAESFLNTLINTGGK